MHNGIKQQPKLHLYDFLRIYKDEILRKIVIKII